MRKDTNTETNVDGTMYKDRLSALINDMICTMSGPIFYDRLVELWNRYADHNNENPDLYVHTTKIHQVRGISDRSGEKERYFDGLIDMESMTPLEILIIGIQAGNHSCADPADQLIWQEDDNEFFTGSFDESPIVLESEYFADWLADYWVENPDEFRPDEMFCQEWDYDVFHGNAAEEFTEWCEHLLSRHDILKTPVTLPAGITSNNFAEIYEGRIDELSTKTLITVPWPELFDMLLGGKTDGGSMYAGSESIIGKNIVW